MATAIQEYWERYQEKAQVRLKMPSAWKFGDGTKEMADTLANLVIKGIKTATTASAIVHEIEEEPFPQVGEYAIILNGDDEPVAIIQYTQIDLVRMNEVSPAYAAAEGEGDLSYDYWYQTHVNFFTWELGLYDMTFTPDLLLVCQSFRVVDINQD